MEKTQEQRLVEMVGRVLEREPSRITLQTCREDVPEWDSLAQVMLIAEFEDVFKKSIPFEETEKIGTVSDFLKYI